MAKAEALKGSPLPPDQLAKEIRAIRTNGKRWTKKWRRAEAQVGQVQRSLQGSLRPSQSPLRQSAQTAQRERIGREDHRRDGCTGDEPAAPSPRGKTRLARSGKAQVALFDQWKKGGGVANAAWKALDEKFDVALKNSTAPSMAREPEIARRRRLIAQAEELAKGNAVAPRPPTPPSFATSLGCRTSAEPAHLRRKDEAELWDELQKAHRCPCSSA